MPGNACVWGPLVSRESVFSTTPRTWHLLRKAFDVSTGSGSDRVSANVRVCSDHPVATVPGTDKSNRFKSHVAEQQRRTDSADYRRARSFRRRGRARRRARVHSVWLPPVSGHNLDHISE